MILFTTTWCGPCKTVKQWIDKYPFVTVIDADEQAELATQYGVRTVPTFIRDDGDRRTGAITEREFVKWVNESG